MAVEPELPSILEAALDRMHMAHTRALLLDYDGTLAPFRPERDQAVPYPGVREILTQMIAGNHTRIVIITGRAIAHLIPLLGLEDLPEIWGTHGWEHRDRDGAYHVFPLSEEQSSGLESARKLAAKMRAEAGDFEQRFEQKPAGVAIHWRGLPEAEAEVLEASVHAAWSTLEATFSGSLHLRRFDGGLELRAAGRTKGDVIETILGELETPCLAVYLGDDLTDEDAFRVIRGRGVGVLVHPEGRGTAAEAHLRPPEELLAFLRAWHERDVRA